MFKNACYILVSLFFFLGNAQQEKDSLSIPEDISSKIGQRQFSDGFNDRYSGELFDYRTNNGEAQNLIGRFLRWLINILGDAVGFNIDPATIKFIEYLIYVLMAVLAVYLLVKFFVGENLSTLFTRKSTAIVDLNLAEVHIENIDLDQLMKGALAKKDFRLAIRYQYLKMLKSLSQRNMIEWHFEKTNSDYEKELAKTKLRPMFAEVSYLYDYIWYGEQHIDETIYNAAQGKFLALNAQIKD